MTLENGIEILSKTDIGLNCPMISHHIQRIRLQLVKKAGKLTVVQMPKEAEEDLLAVAAMTNQNARFPLSRST